MIRYPSPSSQIKARRDSNGDALVNEKQFPSRDCFRRSIINDSGEAQCPYLAIVPVIASASMSYNLKLKSLIGLRVKEL